MEMLQYLQLGESKLAIYKLLSQRPMTIQKLKKASMLSERLLRMHLTELLNKGIVRRKILAENRLKYVYYATPPENMVKWLLTQLTEFDRSMQKKKKNIIRGTKF